MKQLAYISPSASWSTWKIESGGYRVLFAVIGSYQQVGIHDASVALARKNLPSMKGSQVILVLTSVQAYSQVQNWGGEMRTGFMQKPEVRSQS